MRRINSDALNLNLMVWQLGLSSEDADKALTLGARFLAHGFTETDIDNMIRWQYQQWAEDFASDDVSAKLRHFRRWGQNDPTD